MFDSLILDVAIGLALLYVLLATVCSTLNELISRGLGLRATTLRSGVGTMLDDEAFKSIASRVMDHPLITSIASKSGKGPSYIPSKLFALALLDEVFRAAGDSSDDDKPEDEAGDAAPSNLLALLDAASDEDVPAELKRQLRLIIGPDATLESAQERVSDWFDAGMERVEGWYKRKIQLIVLGLAFAVTILLNANTFTFANELTENATLRAFAVSAASEIVDAGGDDLDEGGEAALTDESAGESVHIEKAVETIESFDAGIGWGAAPERESGTDFFVWFGGLLGWWIPQWPGLLITVLAVSLGAPFWFDLLGKVSNLRAVGPKPETEEERRAREVRM